MGFFSSITDSFSRAIGTDGSGGGLLVDLGKPLGFSDSTSGLLNNPGVKEAVIVGAAIYAGPSIFGASGTTAASAVSGATATTGAIAVAPSAGLWATVQSAGSGALTILNTIGKTAGALNVISNIGGRSFGAVTYGPTTGSPPSGGFGTLNFGSLPTQGNQEPEGGTTNASPIIISSAEETPRDSTLSKLAAGLTVVAILYQFSRGK